MRLGYNTNGLAHHDPLEAIQVLAALGYQSVALTIDHGLLHPFASGLSDRCRAVRRQLDQCGLASVVETGARFLLDPWQKHEPTLVTPDPAGRARRVEFLCRAIDMAAELGSDCVSFWSGVVRDGADLEAGFERLALGLRQVIDHADDRGVLLGFEPEPGMLIDTMARFDSLLQWIDAPHFRLTLDVGHLYCQGEVPIVDYIHRWSSRIVNVHLEDMRAGVHEHLMFGEGEMNFPPIIDALRRCGYEGGVHVELSRHSHDGPAAARHAFEFLHPLFSSDPRRSQPP